MNSQILSILLGIALLPVVASAEGPQNPRYIAFVTESFREHDQSFLTSDNIARMGRIRECIGKPSGFRLPPSPA